MDKSILELAQEVTAIQALMGLLFIIALIILCVTQRQKLLKHLNKWRKVKNEEENFHALVYELKNSMEEIKRTQKKQSEDISKLTQITLKIQEKNSETKRAEIKEKIERIFRECHPAMTCTDMQLETLKELIDQYEKHGGDNSFVHSTVQKEMYSWHVINEIKSPSDTL